MAMSDLDRVDSIVGRFIHAQRIFTGEMKAEVAILREQNSFLLSLIQNDALLIERYNAFIDKQQRKTD